MLLLVLIMLSIALYEVPRLLRQKQTGELIAFSVVWCIAFGYAALVTMRVALPTVMDVFAYVYGLLGLPAY